MTETLFQFQCQREGHIFYYQTANSRQFVRALVEFLPCLQIQTGNVVDAGIPASR